MSAESLPRIKGQRDVLPDLESRRPATRIVIGVLVALTYVGILAVVGTFISSAVNAPGDRTAVARATIEKIRGIPPDSTPQAATSPSDATQSAAKEPESPPAATPPPPAVAEDGPALSDVAHNAAAPLAFEEASSQAAIAPQSVTMPQQPQPPAAAVSDEAPPPAIEAQHQESLPPPPLPPASREAVAAAPAVAPVAAAAPAPAHLAAAILDFEKQGDERLATGDIASARLFYERAAEGGDARAARLMGNSYDPAYLARWGVLGMRGDPGKAVHWYRVARDLGDADAAQVLAALPPG
jgi:hypothetical protein